MERDPKSLAAASVLDRIFRGSPFGFAARLWDGTRVAVGTGAEAFTLVFRSAEAFRRLMLRPNTRRFAEAFINGELDVEGDFFAAVGLANRIEALRLGVRDRVAILRELVRLR